MKKELPPNLTGNAIRQTFIDFFEEHRHTHVPSSSLVPGGDATLLFTNSGMVQFKDVFLGTDKRPYTRAANSQKCMRVAGKHNDLDDVGRDDTHHTFFEMLGNWSFGDYYKKEAIEWGWQLLTNVWGLERSRLYATVFKDDVGDIPTDEEAAGYWRQQPGFGADHVFYFGRKDNFWEMAETGPCGPNSEIHYDLHPERGPVSRDDLDTDRFLELWNLVFMQYNRLGPNHLEPLPAKHVDTGLGFERIVSVLQGAGSTYRTDLLWPVIEKTQELSGQSDEERERDFTSYRVIADHARAAAFLIADGVIPGNLGRNYVTRMIIRRGYRFGGMIGLDEPFLAPVAQIIIDQYKGAFPELGKNQKTILQNITREEEQFQRTLDRATTHLHTLLDSIESVGEKTLSGRRAADLYTTYGMPLEITRDIAEERGLSVDVDGFADAMEEHRLASGAGSAIGIMGTEDLELYSKIISELVARGDLNTDGVLYDPYGELEQEVIVLSLVKNQSTVMEAAVGDLVQVLLPRTPFYLEAGGQVSDTGAIQGVGPQNWEISVSGIRQPAAGVIIHTGTVVSGNPKVGDAAIAQVSTARRKDIMRNHTATHLLHAALRHVLGDHARQAGSLVAPDRLRFDFTHPEAISTADLEKIEAFVNEKILENHPLIIVRKPLQQAMNEGVTALFGEKYGEEVRTIRIGDFSYELCGGTHCTETNDIGLFLITSEGSVAAGIRRIEAITGRSAYQNVLEKRRIINQTAELLGTSPEQMIENTLGIIESLANARKEISFLRANIASVQFSQVLGDIENVEGVGVLTARITDADPETLRNLADRFRSKNPQNGVAVLATVQNGKPILVAAVTQDLVNRGLKAGDLAGYVSRQLGGGGGGKPTIAQAGGRDASKLDAALESVRAWVVEKIDH